MFACAVCMYDFIWIYEKKKYEEKRRTTKRDGSTVDKLKYEYKICMVFV